MGFIETILVTDEIQNLDLHNKRMNKTRKYFYNSKPIYLENYIKHIKNKRVRVVYEKEIIKIEYFELQKREFKKFKIVHSDIEYKFKSENRKELNALKVDGFDEVIIIKDGLVTDTTISNLAFFNGKEWHTPKNPLLEGTKREELLSKSIIIQKDIKENEIRNYKKMAMINAIIGFYEVRIDF